MWEVRPPSTKTRSLLMIVFTVLTTSMDRTWALRLVLALSANSLNHKKGMRKISAECGKSVQSQLTTCCKDQSACDRTCLKGVEQTLVSLTNQWTRNNSSNSSSSTTRKAAQLKKSDRDSTVWVDKSTISHNYWKIYAYWGYFLSREGKKIFRSSRLRDRGFRLQNCLKQLSEEKVERHTFFGRLMSGIMSLKKSGSDDWFGWDSLLFLHWSILSSTIVFSLQSKSLPQVPAAGGEESIGWTGACAFTENWCLLGVIDNSLEDRRVHHLIMCFSQAEKRAFCRFFVPKYVVYANSLDKRERWNVRIGLEMVVCGTKGDKLILWPKLTGDLSFKFNEGWDPEHSPVNGSSPMCSRLFMKHMARLKRAAINWKNRSIRPRKSRAVDILLQKKC